MAIDWSQLYEAAAAELQSQGLVTAPAQHAAQEPAPAPKPRAVVGTCRICGQPILDGESYQVTGCGMRHLRHEWRNG